MGSLSTIDKDFVTERLLYLARETAHDAPEVSVVLLALAVPPEALPSNDVNHQRVPHAVVSSPTDSVGFGRRDRGKRRPA